MQYKITNEQPFQVLSSSFSISPSQQNYTLNISADGRNYSPLFTVASGQTRLVTGVASGSYYKLVGNQSEVTVNWVRSCNGGGGQGGNAGELEPVTAFPVGAPEGTVVALASGDTVGVYQYDGTDWVAVGNGGGGSNFVIPAITSQTEYDSISGSVKTGDLIQVYGVDINDDGGPEIGLFQAEVDQGSNSIIWERRDSGDSLLWADKIYPWMVDNGVWPADFGEGVFLISPESNSEDEAYNGIGFDVDGKPVITHIIPEYDEQTGEVTGITRTDTPIGAGGGSVVELTKAEYDALVNPDSGTTYIITDADVVNLEDYAMASGLTELSSSTATALATKADKQNVTARASSTTNPYLPGWNSQGVITGSSQVHSVSMTVNGTAQNNIFRSSNSNLPSFYAPTSAGTAGQPLLSNGSGAPVWGGYKFAFITQTAYDDLATKDATTIYFIIGD